MSPELPPLPRITDLQRIGGGGFADVYRGRQEYSQRWVAAKVFRVPLTERGAGDAFRAECQAVMHLAPHPHVVTVHDVGVLPDGRPYLVMERCDNSVQRLVESRGPLDPARVAEIGIAIADALRHAHASRVIHGDVTPSNVLLRTNDAPVLADFGLAVLRDVRGNVAHGFTTTHTAPETLRHDGAIDERSDVYGLGSTLATALTGTAPFAARPGEEDAARVVRILTEPPRVPRTFGDLLERMLAKNPDERPDLGQVIATLGDPAVAPGGPPVGQTPGPGGPPVFLPPPGLSESSGLSGSRPPGSAERTGSRVGAAPADPTPGPSEATRLRPTADAPAPAPSRGRPAWLVPAGVGGGALVVVIAVVLAVWQPWSPTPPPPVPTTDGQVLLQAPADHGESVDLAWQGPEGYDYAVVVGRAQDQARTQIVGRVGRYTVPVEPGTPYCFRVQAANASGTVVESNVRGIRDAVCRFDG